MLTQAFIDALRDPQKIHHRAWLILYLLSVSMPFAYILLLSIMHPGKQYYFLFDLFLTLFGFFCLLVTFRAILKIFWLAISSHDLTGEKIRRLVLTYFYMLFAFAGIYLVLYFDSDFNSVQQELSKLPDTLATTANPAGLAFTGVVQRFWPVAGSPIAWNNLPVIYLDMLYFSASTMTTLGFGDIVAKLPFVKIVVIIEALCGNLLLVLGMASIVPRKDSDS